MRQRAGTNTKKLKCKSMGRGHQNAVQRRRMPACPDEGQIIKCRDSPISSCPATLQRNHLGFLYLLVLLSEMRRDGARGQGRGTRCLSTNPQMPFHFPCASDNILKRSYIQSLSQKDGITEQQATGRELRLLGTDQRSRPIKIRACALRPRVNATFDGWCPHAHQSLDQERLSKLS